VLEVLEMRPASLGEGYFIITGREHVILCDAINYGESRNVSEVIFLVEEAAEGGFTARALGQSIFTEAKDVAELHEKVRDAVHCHFDEGKGPKVIRLHFVREEVIGV